MKKIRIFLLALFLVLTFSFVSVKVVNAAGAASSNYNETATDAEKVAYDKERIQLPTTMITSFPVTVDSIYKSEITWETSDATVLDTQYVNESGWVELKRDPVETKEATLIVTIKNGTVTYTKEFTISVPGGTTIVNDITVTYSVGEGLTAPTPTTVKIGKAESLPQAPAKEGYEFAGWYGNPEFTGRRYTTTLGLIKDVTLYAKYDKVSVSKITVSKAPNKTAYTALETFDPTGLELNVEYNYGEPKTITSGFTVEPTILHGDTTEVVVSYGGCTTTIKVTVTPIKMTGVELVRGEVTYDGKEHNLTVTGQVPEWLKVTYSAPVTDANEEGYTVTATFSLAEGYDNSRNDYVIPESLTATLVVHKATYDMNNVTFGNLTATYDGNPHDITVEGYPEGVVPSFAYEGGNVNAGSHVVTISFKGDKNYNEIADMTTTLVIEQAEPTVKVVLGKNSPYYVGEKAPDISLGEGSTNGTIAWDQAYTFVEGENTFSWTFTSSDSNYKNSTGTMTLTATSAKVSSIAVTTNPNKTTYTAFEVFDITGMVVTATKEDGSTFNLTENDFTVSYVNGSNSFRAGETKVTISYAGVTVDLEGLTVEKATYDMSQVVYIGLTGAIYNGQAHIVTVDNLPTGVTATVSYPNGNITAGKHEITISFTVADPDNYNTIDDLTKELEIAKATHDVSGITIEGQTFTYDGTAHSLEVIGTLPEGVTVSYENNGQTNVGEYTVTVRFVVTDTENYNGIETSLTATLTIIAKSIENVTVEEITNIKVNAREFDAQTPTLVVKDGTTLLKLTTDYTVAYANNTAISEGISVTATATITGTGNYQGTKEVTFVIELSEQFKLDEDVTEFEEMSTVDTDVVDTLPLVLSNGSKVQYTDIPTAIKLDADGKITVTKTTEAQSYTFKVTIQNGETVKYVEMTIKISARPTTKSFTDNNVTLDNVPSEITSVTVTPDENASSNYEVFTTQIQAAYDIKLSNGDTEVTTFENSIRVSLPCPSGATLENIVVYHVLSAESKEVVEGVTLSEDGNYIVFETKSFSVYLVATKLAQNEGTVDNPFTVEEAVSICNTLGSGESYTAKEYYVKGVVKSVTSTKIVLELNGVEFTLYKSTLATDVITPETGDTVIAKGHFLNYNGKTPEFNSGCTVVAVDAPTYTVTVSTNDSTKGNPYIESEGTTQTTVVRGGTVVITINVVENFRVKTVIVNGTATEYSGDTIELTNVRENKEVVIEYYEPSTYTITFDAQNNTIPTTQTVVEGESLQEPENPTKEGYKFAGWYLDVECTNKYNFENKVIEPFTLYAKWVDESQSKVYKRVTDVSTLKAKDVIILVNEAKGKVAGSMGSASYMSAKDATFENHMLKSQNESFYEITLGGETGAWTLNTSEGVIGTSAEKEINCKGNGTTTWTIEIDDGGNATIASTNTKAGRFLYNSGASRFLNYTSATNVSMLLPQIYKLEQDFVVEDGYVYFGEYPQTLKANDVTIESTTPDADGYYLGSDGERYAEVVAKVYKGSTVYFNNNKKVEEGTTYYFKVEPIKWKILQVNGAEYKLVTDLIIDNQKFHSSFDDRTIDGKTVYANNYEHSDIRNWLNSTFYNVAFTEKLKSYINTTLVDNSLDSTGDASNPYICNDTNDKVYLLSKKDITNTDYGFNSYISTSTGDMSKCKYMSDYAIASGCCVIGNKILDYNFGPFWLRTPGTRASYSPLYIVSDGSLATISGVNCEYVGVAPAITVTITK